MCFDLDTFLPMVLGYQVGITGKYGTRYGASLRQAVDEGMGVRIPAGFFMVMK